MTDPTLPTVKVKSDSPSGFAIINQTDFDKKVHTLWTAAKPKAIKKVVEEPVKEVEAEKPTARRRKKSY